MLAKGGRKPVLFLFGLMLFLSIFYITVYQNLIFPIVGMAIFLFILYFFRDPDREISEGIVSPADGKIQSISQQGKSIEIFMNLWDVHVNRSPWSGKVEKIEHYPGKHLPAFLKNANKNERQFLVLSTGRGNIKIWQIAGITARRIVPYLKKGDRIEKGERIGIVRFGSKVRLEFENKVEFTVKKGQRIKAGETSLGVWHE
ncbi:MAG: phosphatidylserine decarboxylase [Candidatus Natronoplasma sp.]